jgi:hypothetical protein
METVPIFESPLLPARLRGGALLHDTLSAALAFLE